MTEKQKYAVLDYEKLQFYHVYPPSLPGDTTADCLRRAIASLIGTAISRTMKRVITT